MILCRNKCSWINNTSVLPAGVKPAKANRATFQQWQEIMASYTWESRMRLLRISSNSSKVSLSNSSIKLGADKLICRGISSYRSSSDIRGELLNILSLISSPQTSMAKASLISSLDQASLDNSCSSLCQVSL